MPDNRIVVRNVPDQRIPVKNDVPVYLNSTIVKKTITSNGTYRAAEEKANGFDPVVVAVPIPEDYMRVCNKPNFPGLGVFDKEEVELNFDIAYSANQLIYVTWGAIGYPNKKVKHLTVNFAQKLLEGRMMFSYQMDYDEILERITLNADISQIPAANQMFSHCNALRVVDGTPLDFSSATTIGVVANYCKNIEEIRFAPNSIKVNLSFAMNGKLSGVTIQSIIDGLADLTGKTAQTITWHSDVLAKLTDAQIDTIWAKNWTF